MTALGLRSAGRLGLSPRRPGSGRPFSPRSLPGLAFWYDAADSPVIVAGGAIERWDDLSGNARHASQATAGARPIKTTVSGRPVIRFDGIDDALLHISTLSFAAGVSLFAVLTMRARADFSGIVSVAPATGTDHATLFTFRNASAASGLLQWFGRSIDSNSLNVQRTDPGSSAKALAILRADAGNANYRDLTGTSTDTYGGSFGTPVHFTLGARYNGATFGYGAVDLYEVGLYLRLLTDGERDQLVAYLTTRYGL